MKKATLSAVLITTFFYLCCGCFGYAAFGDNTPRNLLTEFGIYEPFWLVDFANACIIVHLIGGYQVYSQPVFAYAEKWFSNKFPHSEFVNKFYTCCIPPFGSFRVNMLRLCFRSNDRHCNDLSLLQRSSGVVGGTELLAYCNLLSSGDVLHAIENRKMVEEVSSSSSFQHVLFGPLSGGSYWISAG